MSALYVHGYLHVSYIPRASGIVLNGEMVLAQVCIQDAFMYYAYTSLTLRSTGCTNNTCSTYARLHKYKQTQRQSTR